MKIRKSAFCVTLSLSLFCSFASNSVLAATFTPGGAVKGRGIDFLFNVAANLFTDILKGALNINLDPNTSLATTDFTSRNINTAYVIIALADDAQDKKSFFGSGNGQVSPEQIVSAQSTQWPGTNAKIGALIERGFLGDTIALGSPPKSSLELNLQNFKPGPLSEDRTTSAAFGFVFANGNFIFGGQEKSRKIPKDPVRTTPEPTSTLNLLALGAALTLKRKLKTSKSSERELEKVG